MKSFVLAVAALLTVVAHPAAAAEPWEQSPRENAVMLYFHKSFGPNARGRELPLAYGLRLQQSSPFVGAARVDLIDLDFSQNLRASLLNGALQLNAFGDKEDDDENSSEDSSDDDLSEWSAKNKAKVITFSIIGLVGVACGLEWGICKSSGRGGTSETPGNSPGLGQGG